jgi:hypothetical protein
MLASPLNPRATIDAPSKAAPFRFKCATTGVMSRRVNGSGSTTPICQQVLHRFHPHSLNHKRRTVSFLTCLLSMVRLLFLRARIPTECPLQCSFQAHSGAISGALPYLLSSNVLFYFHIKSLLLYTTSKGLPKQPWHLNLSVSRRNLAT